MARIAEKKKLTLDNTSSVIVQLSNRKRRAKKPAMKKPFQVESDGVTIWCDTAEQAAEVARELATAKPPAKDKKWSVHEFQEFVNRVQYPQRVLLASLLNAKYHRAADDELRAAAGVGSNQALAGVLSGITKVAQLLEIDPRRVYWMNLVYEKGKPVRTYYLADVFAKAAIENYWPSDSDLKDPDDEEDVGRDPDE